MSDRDPREDVSSAASPFPAAYGSVGGGSASAPAPGAPSPGATSAGAGPGGSSGSPPPSGRSRPPGRRPLVERSGADPSGAGAAGPASLRPGAPASEGPPRRRRPLWVPRDPVVAPSPRPERAAPEATQLVDAGSGGGSRRSGGGVPTARSVRSHAAARTAGAWQDRVPVPSVDRPLAPAVDAAPVATATATVAATREAGADPTRVVGTGPDPTRARRPPRPVPGPAPSEAAPGVDGRESRTPEWLARRVAESEVRDSSYEIGEERRWGRRKVTVLRTRTNRRLVRRIDTWTVFKMSFLFYLLMVAAVLIAGTVSWSVAQHLGFVTDIQKSVRSLADDRKFILHGNQAFKYTAAAGAVLGLLGTVFNTVAAMLYNLLSDVVGGVQVVVVTEPD